MCHQHGYKFFAEYRKGLGDGVVNGKSLLHKPKAFRSECASVTQRFHGRWEAEITQKPVGQLSLCTQHGRTKRDLALKLGVKQELTPRICSLTSTHSFGIPRTHDNTQTHLQNEQRGLHKVNTLQLAPLQSPHAVGRALWVAWCHLPTPRLCARGRMQ